MRDLLQIARGVARHRIHPENLNKSRMPMMWFIGK